MNPFAIDEGDLAISADRVAEQVCTGAYRLSKSRIAAFEHCPRRLWLQVHCRQLARYDEKTLALFAIGHQVGKIARVRYPSGILVDEDHRNLVAALGRTFELIRARDQQPIFEAAFQHAGVIVRADIIEPDGWGGWRLIEVKASSRVRTYQLFDLASQAWVLGGNGICVSAMIIRRLERRLRGETVPPWISFVDEDMTEAVLPIVPSRSQVVNRARHVLSSPEPQIAPGGHCERPFRCEFRDYCSQRHSASKFETEKRR